MKLIKMIYVVACLTILATGCDSDDGEVLNTADVSVEFGQASVTVKETEEFVTVPVLVTDNAQRNGDIIVQITMKGNTGGFQLDKEVIVTTQTLRIPPQEKSIDFEVGLHVYNVELATGRNVEFEITDVKGATIGAERTYKINIVERIFAEGTYEIDGLDAFYEMRMYGKVQVTALDESFDYIRLDFGIGGQAEAKFTEIIAEQEYDFEISPFQFIGTFNTADVYLTWMRKPAEGEDKTGNEEEMGGLYYDITRPMKGKLVRTVNGKETKIVITMEDGFGLLGDRGGVYTWFDNVWLPDTKFTKID